MCSCREHQHTEQPHAVALLPGNKTYFCKNHFFEQSDEKIRRWQRQEERKICQNKTAANEQNAKDRCKYENNLEQVFKSIFLKLINVAEKQRRKNILQWLVKLFIFFLIYSYHMCTKHINQKLFFAFQKRNSNQHNM